MSFYHLPTNTERHPGRLETKLSDGAQLGPPDWIGWTPELAALCGFVTITHAARPDDTATDTHDRSVELVDGTPTVVWTSREWTLDELAARAAQANDATIRARVADALDANRSFLAVESPTNAQTLAQVKALTRQTQALIRLVTAQTADGVD
jgi:hypothetical protein